MRMLPEVDTNHSRCLYSCSEEAAVEPISRKYRDRIMRMMASSSGQSLVSDKNVHQPGNPDILPFIDRIIEANLLPGSGINGVEHLDELLESRKGARPVCFCSSITRISIFPSSTIFCGKGREPGRPSPMPSSR